MMKMPEMSAKTFRLSECTTREHLECNWSVVLQFGDKILLAGYYYMGINQPCWFGAVYKFSTDDHSCESSIVLCGISQSFFEDEGHAIAWAMKS